ncbi:MAG: hypothetical protein AABY15_08670 [Nanoarchaeota archaeon]
MTKTIKEEAVMDLYDPNFCSMHNIDYLEVRNTEFYKAIEIVLKQYHIRVARLN